MLSSSPQLHMFFILLKLCSFTLMPCKKCGVVLSSEHPSLVLNVHHTLQAPMEL